MYNQKQKMTQMHINKGFTLIELLIVISIIGVLSTIVISSINIAKNRAEGVKLLVHAKELQKGIEAFQLFEGRLPTTGTETNQWGNILASNCGSLSDPGYLTNWNLFITDMGDYLPASFEGIAADWPNCFFYKFDGHIFCEVEPNAEYIMIFAAYDSTYTTLDSYIDGQDNTRYCLYPL